MTENLEARARSDVRPAWQRNSPKDNIPDLTRRGARQPQDGIARGDVPARDARAASGLRAPRSRAVRRCAQTTRAYGQTPSDQSGTNNVGKKSHLARSDRTAVVPRATSKGYGYGYGFEYGFKYGHGYGEPELGGKTGKTVAPSATSILILTLTLLTLHHLRIQGMVGQGWQDRPKHHRRTRRRRAPLLRPHLQHLLRLLTPRCHVLVV